jgi:VanZ family protein
MIGFWGIILVIGFLSLQPIDNLPDVQIWDKIQHLVAYGAMVLAGLIAYPRYVWRVMAVTIAYGIAIEFLQRLVPGRFPSFGDAVANTLGAVMALFMMRLGLARRLGLEKSS